MLVHISQPVYDLIYDQNFVFKEKGEIEVKGKKYNTFLVTGYKDWAHNCVYNSAKYSNMLPIEEYGKQLSKLQAFCEPALKCRNKNTKISKESYTNL